MKPTLALSTAWCSHRHNDGYAMLREMADFGFEYVELSHGVKITLVPGILRAVEEGWIKVGSTHNFCPLPAGIVHAAPNLYEPSSRDRREREQWLRHTKRSIDFGAQVGASVLVCHLGSVVFFWLNPVRKIKRYLKDHPMALVDGDKEFKLIQERAFAKLRKAAAPFWENTRTSLLEALKYADSKGIRLGLENREKFEELPIDADYPVVLAGLPTGSPAGYWHDVGHAQIKQSLGILDHRHQLEANAEKLIGFHLHDVDAKGHDHQCIGKGRVDYRMVSEFWKPEHRLVLELGPRVTPDEVIFSKTFIEALMPRVDWD